MSSSPAPHTAVLYPAFVATLPSVAGKTVAITGCTSGTGLVRAEALLWEESLKATGVTSFFP